MTSNSRKRHLIRIVFVVAIALIVLGVTGWAVYRHMYGPIPFQRELWLQAIYTQGQGPRGIGIRSRMIGDLANEYGLVGMSRMEVEDLLGPPDVEYSQDDKIQYLIKFGYSIISSPQQYLLIYFDDEDTTVEYEVVWH